MMKIEAGKSYPDQRGVMWTALGRNSDVKAEPWRMINPYGHISLFSDDGESAHCKLVLEAPTGPVVVEPRKRIVPGTYGIIQVRLSDGEEGVYLRADPFLCSGSQLRAAAATLTEIADVLDEGAR